MKRTKSQDGLAMRWTDLGARMVRAVLALGSALALGAGCHRSPYIEQSPRAERDLVEAALPIDPSVRPTSHTAPSTGRDPFPIPPVQPPRTVSFPDADEIWELTLEDAIRIGLENGEVVRVIALGAQGIPVAGFEPSPLNLGVGGALGAGGLATVYDPAIQETSIANALAAFDANITSQLTWGRSVTPVNNALAAGAFFNAVGAVPVISDNRTAQWTTTLSKRAMTGTTFSVTHNIQFAFSNSPINVTPSAYTVNTQVAFTHPLLGGTANNPSGVEANRANIVIARLNADSAVFTFKSEVMASVRSIEQQYWALSQQLLQLWARQTAVELGEQIVAKTQAEYNVGRGAIADVAEAEQTLENFRLQYLQALSDTVNTERQLRNILGLPPADNRRIIPATAPLEARVVPDWERSLLQMVSFNPDLVRLQLGLRISELQLLLSRNTLLPVLNIQALYQLNGLAQNLDTAHAIMTGRSILATDPIIGTLQNAAGLVAQPSFFNNFETWQVGLTFDYDLGRRAAMANVRNAQYNLLRQKALLKQTLHQDTHALARFFNEVDSNYKLLKVTGRLRNAAKTRLEVAQARYSVGDIPIDRYLDAVSQWANSVAQEAQFKTSYNNSLVVLEEAKGTLLAYNNVVLAEGPQPHQAYIQAVDQRGAHGQFHIGHDGPLHPDVGSGPLNSDPIIPDPPAGYQPDPNLPDFFPAPVGPRGAPTSPAVPGAPTGEPNFLGFETGFDEYPRDALERLPRLPEPPVPPTDRVEVFVVPTAGPGDGKSDGDMGEQP